MKPVIRIRRHRLRFAPESNRVIIRPFIPANRDRIVAILGRILALNEEEATREWTRVREAFAARHFDIEPLLITHYLKVHSLIDPAHSLTRVHQLLIGAIFSGEYALESAALFNPSIVPHPDQTGVPAGAVRFIMSLRATGEGHISSIEFRSGQVSKTGRITVDPVSRFVSVPEVLPNPRYRKTQFTIKLREMGFVGGHATAVLASLDEQFTRSELMAGLEGVRCSPEPKTRDLERTLECIQWLADSNYEVLFSSKLTMSERIIFPVSSNESNGIEDARFVRFVDDDGTVLYYATYTAFNGRAILPQLIETEDFLHFRVLTLNGSAVQNKGMAFFPRRIGGRYAMLSRQDDENLFLMFSDHPHFWNDPQLLLRPAAVWESVKVGNCGSPIETEAGWLVITHGVGPMRTYCLGAALLDLDDPTRVLGRLAEPLISPQDNEREGYVPNVVYSCGAMLHRRELILPYAMSDQVSAIVSLSLDDLLAALLGRNGSGGR